MVGCVYELIKSNQIKSMPLGNLGERTVRRKRKDEGTTSVTTVAKVDTIPLIALPKNRRMKESHTAPWRPQWEKCRERRNRETRIPRSRKSTGTPRKEN
jgi:hypothetical protein